MIYGISSTEFQERPNETIPLAKRAGARAIRMVIYRNNPQTLSQTVIAAKEAREHDLKLSIVLIDGPGVIGGPIDVKKFGSWAIQVAGIFLGEQTCRKFVIWNEPNHRTRFWKASPALYESLLYYCRNGLKDLDQRIEVVGFGLARRSSMPFFHQVMRAWEKRHRPNLLMDSLSIHPYPLLPKTEQVEQTVKWVKKVREALVEHKHIVPLHCDEYGLQLHDVGEAKQAIMYAQMQAALAKLGYIKSFHTYLLKDRSDPAWTSGLLHPTGETKAAWRTVQYES